MICMPFAQISYQASEQQEVCILFQPSWRKNPLAVGSHKMSSLFLTCFNRLPRISFSLLPRPNVCKFPTRSSAVAFSPSLIERAWKRLSWKQYANIFPASEILRISKILDTSEGRIIFGFWKSQNWRIYHSNAPENCFFFLFIAGMEGERAKRKSYLTVNQIINSEATKKLRFGDHPNENFDRTKQLLVETMELRLFACVQSYNGKLFPRNA